jgi:hypothetical protein
MRRFFAMLTAAVCVLALTVPAFADVIWTPEDDFFKAHQSECKVERRNYYINSRDGWADLQISPVNEKTVARAKNGAEVTVGFTYEKNGVKWGVVYYNAAENKKDWTKWDKESGVGWVKMSELLLIYDEQSFEEEHGKEFTAYDGSFDKLCTSADQRVIVWSYPGSGGRERKPPFRQNKLRCTQNRLRRFFAPLHLFFLFPPHPLRWAAAGALSALPRENAPFHRCKREGAARGKTGAGRCTLPRELWWCGPFKSVTDCACGHFAAAIRRTKGRVREPHAESPCFAPHGGSKKTAEAIVNHPHAQVSSTAMRRQQKESRGNREAPGQTPIASA